MMQNGRRESEHPYLNTNCDTGFQTSTGQEIQPLCLSILMIRGNQAFASPSSFSKIQTCTVLLKKEENDSGLHQQPFLTLLRWHDGEDATCKAQGWNSTAFPQDSTSNEECSDEALAPSARRGQALNSKRARDFHPGDMSGLQGHTAQPKLFPSSPPASPIFIWPRQGQGEERL